MISYLCAFLAAVANGSSNVLNRKATQQEPARAEFRPKLILDLLRRRTWLVAVAITLVSFILGATALGTGQLAAVQIIIILELPLTLIGGAKFLGSHLGGREWAAIAGLTSGVIGLLGCLDPQSGQTPKIPAAQWIIGSIVTAGPMLLFFLVARKSQKPNVRAALLGVATGLGFGLASAYTKGMTEQFSSGGISAALTSWQLYAAGVAGITATWLVQNAYHAGRLAAAQPGITLADPAVSTVWGIAVFGEQVRGGPFLMLGLIPLAAIVGSMVLLSRSPVLQAAPGESPGEPSEDSDRDRGAKDKASRAR